MEAQAKVGNYGSWNQKQGSRKCPGRLVGCPNSGRPTSTYHSRENDESNMARNAKGTEIARCEQVASVVLQQKEIAKAESEMLHLPEHLKELYMRSSHGLTEDQCQQTMYFLDAVASREATSSNALPSSFSFSPFQYMLLFHLAHFNT